LNFLTKILKIPKEEIAVTCFKGEGNVPKDNESAKIWKDLGIKKIEFLGKDNWWGPVGETGPCGPDTELFYWMPNDKPVPKTFDPNDEENWVEIWNNVFMEYNRTESGYEPLSQKNVDTGMGFERITMALQNKSSIYQTDIFKDIMETIEKYSDSLDIKSKRIIADHLRTSTLLIFDDVLPSNVDQGYILRRLIRRAIMNLRKLGFVGDMINPIAEEVFQKSTTTISIFKKRKRNCCLS